MKIIEKLFKKEEPKKNHDLLFLGIGATLIALTTTSVSLILYHNSGDIYLDRSRPGFLPDEDEVKNTPPVEDYEFSETEPITEESLDEYLKHYQSSMDELDLLEDPYSSTPLSDESLGIPEK